MTKIEELERLVGKMPEGWDQWSHVRFNAFLRGAYAFQAGEQPYDTLGHSASPYTNKAGLATMWWHMGWSAARDHKEETKMETIRVSSISEGDVHV